MASPSPPDPSNCPPWQILADYHSNRLPAPARREVDTHVTACTDCESILVELSGESADSLGERLMMCLRGGPTPSLDEAGYLAMEAAAKALAPHDTDRVAAGEFTLRDGVPALPAETRVGSYLLGRGVGRGGMGVVYLARHATLRHEVALKMIRAGGFAGPETLARFRTEAEAIARLRHPNIARLYEFGAHRGLPYFTMEWLGGGTLTDKLSAGLVPFREAAELVRVLAGAMNYAHGCHVVHRDLKPGNILFGEDGTPKVADFGLAKLLDEEAPQLTPTDAVLGTPSYMALEQAEGRMGAVGPAVDVYALGAILYELLTDRPPYLGKTKAETLLLVIAGNLVPPSRVRTGGVPADLEAVCLKCLEREPARRYATAGALADDLGRWLSHKPTIARPLGRFARFARVARRRAAAVGVGLLVAGSVAFGATAMYPRPAVPEPTPIPAPDRASEEALRELEAKLAKGLKVELIGATGWPKWSRWLAGERLSKASLEADGTFALHTQGDGLLELLPAPKTDRYKLTAQIRHDRSSYPGEVGLCVARTVYPWPPQEINYFVQFSFNAVRGAPPGVVQPPRGQQIDETTAVKLFPRLFVDDDAPLKLDSRGGEVSGPRLTPLKELNGRWHDLEVTVTPDGIDATLNSLPLAIPRAEIAKRIAFSLDPVKKTGYPRDPIIQALQPEYTPRGGLGLVLLRGSASFRNVSIKPLQ